MSSDAARATPGPLEIDGGPLGPLPRVDARALATARRVAELPLAAALDWLAGPLGGALRADPPEVLARGAGLKRPGVVAQMIWTRLGTRVGLGLETVLAHVLVDRLLGYDPAPGEERRQVTPVEWGILTYTLARTLAALGPLDGPLAPYDLVIDRVSPDSFDAADLGPIVTVRWPVHIGDLAGSARLWLPESVVAGLVAAPPPRSPKVDAARLRDVLGDLAGDWRAVVGTVAMPRGLGRLAVGGVLTIDGAPLRGTPGNPDGPVALTLDARGARYLVPARPAPMSGGGRLTLTGPLRREPSPREPLALAAEPAAVDTNDLPATLVVELGRISLALRQLADLKPGDVLTLTRHARSPVELTSGGRLVARGELVQVDTELGVRITTTYF